MNQGSRYRRIHAAGQTANRTAIFAEHDANALDLFLDGGRRRPITLAATNLKQEISQNLCAKRRVRHFGMKQDAVDSARTIFEGVDGVFGCCRNTETVRDFGNVIAVTRSEAHTSELQT